MKFLIFNLIVFSALGYMLTASPNENFIDWFHKKKDMVTNLTKEDYIKKAKNAIKTGSEEVSKVKSENFDEKMKSNVNKQINLSEKNLLAKVENLKNELQKIKNEKNVNIQNTSKVAKKVLKKKKTSEVTNLIQKKELNSGTTDKLYETNNKGKLIPKTLDQNKFLTNEERSKALAELITDLEIYSLTNIVK